MHYCTRANVLDERSRPWVPSPMHPLSQASLTEWRDAAWPLWCFVRPPSAKQPTAVWSHRPSLTEEGYTLSQMLPQVIICQGIGAIAQLQPRKLGLPKIRPPANWVSADGKKRVYQDVR